jgi:hypothetical protein
MPPGELFLAGKVKRGGGKLDYCWIVWHRGHNGKSECEWLKREKPIDRQELLSRRSNRSASFDGAPLRRGSVGPYSGQDDSLARFSGARVSTQPDFV